MNIAGTFLGGIFEIAGALIGIALIALLINRSRGTAQVIQAGSSGLDRLLRTVTLQNSGLSTGSFGG